MGLSRCSSLETSTVLKYYLVAYNIVSALGWLYVLIGTLVHLFNLDAPSSPFSAKLASVPFLSKAATFLNFSRTAYIEKRLPASLGFLVPVLRRATTTFDRVGWQTTVVQTLAIMEVVHSLLGWVRSPLVTVAMQVASRYYIVWGITSLFKSVCPVLAIGGWRQC